MGRLSVWPAILGLALAMIVVTLVQEVSSSLSYASGILVIVSLLGWVLEARQVAGPPPAIEPEHEEEEEAPGPSYWPVLLAAGIVGISSGLIYDGRYGALVVAVPLAIGSAAAWMSILRREVEENMPTPEQQAERLALPGPGGRMMLPVANNQLALQAAGGAAIAIEQSPAKGVSRRNLLAITFWTGLGAGLLGIAGTIVDMLYPRGITGFGGVVSAGTTDQYPAGSKTQIFEGRFWLVNLTEQQGGPGFLALWWKCPHLGCTVPWRSDFHFTDPATGADKVGWFRCPCHGSTYNDAGVRVFGPAPRSMDRMDMTISGGKISVNTGKVTKGSTDNPKFAVKG